MARLLGPERGRPVRDRLDHRDDADRAEAGRHRRGVRAAGRGRTRSTEFQRAFTLELGLALLFAVLIAIAAPVIAAAYGEPRLLPLTLAVAYLPIAFALQAPLWIFFRRMDFIRQRSLQAVVPLTTFAVTVPLVVAGVGVWSLVIGAFAGNVAAAVLADPAVALPARAALRPRPRSSATWRSRGRCSWSRSAAC